MRTQGACYGSAPWTAKLALVFVMLGCSAAMASSSLQQPYRITPSGIQRLRQLPPTDKGTMFHGCLMQLAAGVEQAGDARIMDIRQEYELASITNAIGPAASEQLAVQLTDDHISAFCQATEFHYPANKRSHPSSGHAEAGTHTTEAAYAASGKLTSSGRAHIFSKARHGEPSANRRRPRARAQQLQNQTFGAGQTSDAGDCDAERDCNMYGGTKMCVHANAEYTRITEGPGVRPPQPADSFARIVQPLEDNGLYGSKYSFQDYYHKVRTDKDKLAVAVETCEAFQFVMFIANVACNMAGAFGTWEGVGGGGYQTPGETVCLLAVAVLEAGLKTCLLFTQFAETADEGVDQPELQGAYYNSRNAVLNQLLMHKQVSTLQTDFDGVTASINSELCEIKDMIAGIQREANYLRYLTCNPPKQGSAAYAESQTSCKSVTPAVCSQGFDGIAVPVPPNLEECGAAAGTGSNLPGASKSQASSGNNYPEASLFQG